MVPFDFNLVRVCREGLRPILLRTLLSPDGQSVLDSARETILKTQAEIDDTDPDAFVTPYTDPRLRDRRAMMDLVRSLHAGGRITWRRRCLCKVGVFTVAKKDNSQRLIFDCRLAGAMCRPAPHTELSTAGAICELQWPTCSETDPENKCEVSFAGSDLTDALEGLSDLFA